MSREIKFRAWDNKTKQMIAEGFAVIGETTMFSMVNQFLFENKGAHETVLGRLGDVVLMQYTGLKDKNGKDIYEGDLISESGSVPYEVVWQHHSAQWIMQSTATGRTYRHMAMDYAARDYEVIGNIYENPELLKP